MGVLDHTPSYFRRMTGVFPSQVSRVGGQDRQERGWQAQASQSQGKWGYLGRTGWSVQDWELGRASVGSLEQRPLASPSPRGLVVPLFRASFCPRTSVVLSAAALTATCDPSRTFCLPPICPQVPASLSSSNPQVKESDLIKTHYVSACHVQALGCDKEMW